MAESRNVASFPSSLKVFALQGETYDEDFRSQPQPNSVISTSLNPIYYVCFPSAASLMGTIINYCYSQFHCIYCFTQEIELYTFHILAEAEPDNS